MTIEELWKNLKPLVGKVDNIEGKVDKLEGKVDKLENKVDHIKNELQEEMQKMKSELQEEMNGMKEEMHEMKEEIHEIKDVNMTTIIKEQYKIRKELKEVGNHLNRKLDQYIEKNEVEHKKFEYQIANIEWQNKIAN